MPDARTQLQRQYHEMRWRILSLAADLGRLQRLDVVGNTVWRNQQMHPLYDMNAHSADNVRFANNVVYAGRGRQLNGEALPGVT